MPHPLPLATLPLGRSIDPEALFAGLTGDAFWLDAGADAASGWSVLGTGTQETDAAAPGAVRIDAAPTEDPSRPPFRGGWVGWLDYESGAEAVGAPVHTSRQRPAWLRVERAVAIDHRNGSAWALAAEDELTAWSAEIIRGVDAGPVTMPAAEQLQSAVATARHTPAQYETLIARCREAIRRGDAYQLCLTTAFEVAGVHDPLRVHRRLRRATPAHHGGIIRIGGLALVSASPEQFLRTEGGRVRTRPIKGTRPRGVDERDDRRLAAELHASLKERAENVMIVDLMRNDLSRVCEPRSIRVDGLWEVESYPAVHQLVSTVSGRLRQGTTAAELWAAAFPAGSMTGAPKLSAMGLLHELEKHPRGVYSGCFGYIGLDGSADLAMVIRSILIEPERAMIGAGGGITWRSEPADEVAEVATKARAPLAALGAGLAPEWRTD